MEHHENSQAKTCESIALILKSEVMVLKTELMSIKERVLANERRIRDGENLLDGHLEKIWTNLREGQDKLKELVQKLAKENHDLVQSHAADDSKAMTEIREQLLARVPAWALALITAGGTVIGAMLTYILDHLKH